MAKDGKNLVAGSKFKFASTRKHSLSIEGRLVGTFVSTRRYSFYREDRSGSFGCPVPRCRCQKSGCTLLVSLKGPSCQCLLWSPKTNLKFFLLSRTQGTLFLLFFMNLFVF